MISVLPTLCSTTSRLIVKRQPPPQTLVEPSEGRNPDHAPDEADSNISANSTLDQELDTDKGELRGIFDHFDQNKDGRISVEEMSSSLQKLGLFIPSDELRRMMESAYTNADGFVDFSEFLYLYYSIIERNSSEDAGDHASNPEEADLKQGFQVFDNNGDRYICADELYSVLSRMGILAMISKVDEDGDGQVNFLDFKQMMSMKSHIS